jgi:hypothetical protein
VKKCLWYISFEQPECGREAVTEIVDSAGEPFPLCEKHKGARNAHEARQRRKGKRPAPPYLGFQA